MAILLEVCFMTVSLFLFRQIKIAHLEYEKGEEMHRFDKKFFKRIIWRRVLKHKELMLPGTGVQGPDIHIK